MECIRGKTSAEIDVERLARGVAGYGNVLIDIGTGDGRYILHVARTRPNWFALGVDACRENLRKASRKAPSTPRTSSPMRSRCPGSWMRWRRKLLSTSPGAPCSRGLLDGEPMLLEGLLAIARPGAVLEIRLNAEALREAGYALESGGARVRQALHEKGGFEVVGDLLRLDARGLRRCQTTWVKRLAYGRDPRAVCLTAVLGSHATSA